MDVYLSSVGMLQQAFRSGEIPAEECSILCSFYGISDFEKEYLSRFKKVMIDSGAFSFIHGKGREIKNWDDYLNDYANFIQKYDIDLFFELDIDNLVGYEKVLEMREKLSQKTNKLPIPVWHPNRGTVDFIKTCQEYPYVAIGSAKVHGISRQVQEKTFPWFIETAHKFGAKIHGLGYTALDGLTRYKFDSVDSTTWLVGARYGNVVRITEQSGKLNGKRGTNFLSWQSHVPQGLRVSSTYELSKINFITFLNFQKYAEQNL